MRYPLDNFPRVTTEYMVPEKMASLGKHLGIDWEAKVGTPVYSPGNGTVSDVSTGAAGGKTIAVDIGGYTWRFLHLSEQLVKKGDLVSEGQIIAKTGKTGKVTGAHLHCDVRVKGTAWNASLGNYRNPRAVIEEANHQPAPGKNWVPAGAVGMDVILSRNVSSWRIYKPGTREVVATLNPKKNGGRYLVEAIDRLPNRVIIKSPTYGRVSLPVDADATFARAA